MRAVRVTGFGPPEVLRVGEVDEPVPAAGQVLVAVELAGVAYGDVIVRSGRFPLPLPWTPGLEVGGQILAVGPGVDQNLIGKIVVATTVGQQGGYAELALATAAYAFEVPDGLSLEIALTVFQAGALARGLLAAMQLRTHDTVLITAAAGRIGSLLVQHAKSLDAVVIGAASSDKGPAVREFGADQFVDYSADGWGDRVREFTAGVGATLVLDAVGGEVAGHALAAAADGIGRIGFYGVASGQWPTLDPQVIIRRGLMVSGALGRVIGKSDVEQQHDAAQAIAAASRGELVPRIHGTFKLDEAAQAHHELEQRRSIGAVLLRP